MGVRVEVRPAMALRAGEQASVLVGADGADGGAAEVREVLDPVGGCRRRLGRTPCLTAPPGQAFAGNRSSARGTPVAHSGGSNRAILRSAFGVNLDMRYAPRASGVTGTTASPRTTARRIASATFSGG